MLRTGWLAIAALSLTACGSSKGGPPQSPDSTPSEGASQNDPSARPANFAVGAWRPESGDCAELGEVVITNTAVINSAPDREMQSAPVTFSNNDGDSQILTVEGRDIIMIERIGDDRIRLSDGHREACTLIRR
jgi:hypothetical protein